MTNKKLLIKIASSSISTLLPTIHKGIDSIFEKILILESKNSLIELVMSSVLLKVFPI